MWAIVDSFDYYLSFLLWSTITLSSLTFNFVYSYFFFNNFSKKTKISDLFIKRVKIKNDYDVFSDKRLSSSKFDLNWILYSWLSNNKVKNKHFLIENLFEAHVNKSWWEKNFNFFITLYKTFFFLNYINEGSDAYSVKQGINGVSSFFIKKNTNNLLLFISNNFLINKYTDVLLFHSLNKYSNFFSQKNNFLMHKNFKNWNLNFFLKNEDKYVFLLKSKIGFFFFNDFNYQKLNCLFTNFNEFYTLNFYIKNQINSSKWNRWLYRYSILHRKIFKNSHKITMSKNLINSGLYDNNFFNKNLWNSVHFSKYENNAALSSFFKNYYRGLFSLDRKNFLVFSGYNLNNLTQKKNLHLLSFYEKSYFWFLKRFYFFNTLPANAINSKFRINYKNNFILNDLIDLQGNNYNKYSLFLNLILKSNLNGFSLLSDLPDKNFLNLNISKDKGEFSSFFSKDLYLQTSTNDLLSKDNLSTLFWITLTSSETNNNFFLKYFNDSRIVFKNFNYVSSTGNDKFLLNYYLFYSMVDTNYWFLSDTSYLDIFY